MTERQYQKLLDRIKFDLYQEFINPETATYGVKYVEDEPILKVNCLNVKYYKMNSADYVHFKTNLLMMKSMKKLR